MVQMSQQEKMVIKTSPVVFLKRLVIIELLFALISIFLFLSFDLNQIYDDLQLVRIISYGVLLSIIITLFQVLIVAFAFVTWYADTYEVDKNNIVRRRGNFGGEWLPALHRARGMDVRPGRH